jgi:hypothetical protein
LKEEGIEGMFLSTIKAIYDKQNQHHIKWRTTEYVSLKDKNKTGLSTFSTPIQYTFGIPSQSNNTRARNKRDSNKEGNQTIAICI